MNRNVSHIGLGVSAMQNQRALSAEGYMAEVHAVGSGQELLALLDGDRETATLAHHVPISHVVVSAPWIPTQQLSLMAHKYPDVQFTVLSHSNVGFLQADPRAIALLREGADLERARPNFHIAANSRALRNWWQAAYQTPMLLLPNMYPFEAARGRRTWSGGTLRIGCFCAIRPYKNVLTAAAAALEVGVRLRASDLEFWMSGGRTEGGGTMAEAIHQMYVNVPRAKVVRNDWESWPQFLGTVGSMDLLIQPSYTETFNMVTADGIARGVPSVVGEAIAWAPKNWMAATDSACDLADRAVALLHDPSAIEQGVEALNSSNEAAMREWKKFLALRG
ncbi:MAG TPA: glycosyltransferase [Terriglobales bacterium]|nr:glycosyltransferase [Terriglobales bacterium]